MRYIVNLTLVRRDLSLGTREIYTMADLLGMSREPATVDQLPCVQGDLDPGRNPSTKSIGMGSLFGLFLTASVCIFRVPENVFSLDPVFKCYWISLPGVFMIAGVISSGFQMRTAMKTTKLFWGVLLMMAMTPISTIVAQVQTVVPPIVAGAKPVTVERIKVHGAALEGNLEGDAVDRDVIVFLPPGYSKDKHRRYPVVYALHGYSIGAEQWSHEIHVPQTIEGAFAQGAKDMIVVLPDSKTVHNGSMYSSSVTTGDFEKFISHDLVAYIDAHYRTIPNRESRGLVGHSMGGYGASRIGMKHPDVFGSLYIMSPCCMSAGRRDLNPEHGEDFGSGEDT